MSLVRWIGGSVVALAIAAPASAHEPYVRALIDVTASTHGDAQTANWDEPGTSPFDPYRVRAFLGDRLTDRFAVHGQLLYQEATGLRLIGAYVQYTPWPARDLHLQAGKVPWPIGTYSPRAYSDRNPLISTPLLYQFHTGLGWYRPVADTDDLLAYSVRGNPFASDDPNYAAGMPVIWESWWDTGIIALGSVRPFEAAFGVLRGTPGWANAGEEENSGKCFLGRLGVMPHPAIRAGISGAIGPYLLEDANEMLPLGKTAEDYDQRLAMVDAEFLLGHLEVRGEAYRNVWQTPFVGSLRVSGYYVEGKYTFPVGLYLAGRWEIQRYSEVTDSTGAVYAWQTDRNRAEVGVGFRFTRNVTARAVYQENVELGPRPDGDGSSYGLAAAQLTVGF